jgi:hypothetical protein
MISWRVNAPYRLYLIILKLWDPSVLRYDALSPLTSTVCVCVRGQLCITNRDWDRQTEPFVHSLWGIRQDVTSVGPECVYPVIAVVMAQEEVRYRAVAIFSATPKSRCAIFEWEFGDHLSAVIPKLCSAGACCSRFPRISLRSVAWNCFLLAVLEYRLDHMA